MKKNNLSKKILEIIFNALKKMNIDFNIKDITVSIPKNSEFGDYTTNIAFKISSNFNSKPIDTARKIALFLNDEIFSKVEVINPGFINFFLKKKIILPVISEIIEKNELYGSGENKNKKINIEFVSANPTGDLHVGHVRCAIYGDVLSKIMSFAGYNVVREYYVNDAGNQIVNLAESVYQRYLQLFGRKFCIPSDGYNGKDIIELAKYFKDKYGDKLLEHSLKNLEIFKKESVKKKMCDIKQSLKKIGIVFDVFSYETKIIKSKKVEKILKKLNKFIYSKNGAKFIKTSKFLDDKDHVLLKKNGSFTYFLPDIAYHYDKINRGFDFLINILGADHHGYVNRMKSALMMGGYSQDILKIILIQLVKIVDNNGNEIRMSKREGNALILKELIKEINVNVIRYFFVSRCNTSHLKFNFDLAKISNNNNPVYYVMYAHARLNNVLELAKNKKIKINFSDYLLSEKIELKIIDQIKEFPNLIDKISKNYRVHDLISYIFSLASMVHSYYNKYRIINDDDPKLSSSRLALISAIKIVLRNALKLVGIKAPNRM